jgi:peptide/nickel transport system substrate-binding protein
VLARVKDAVLLDPAHATDGLSLNTTSEVMQNLVTFKPGSFDVVPDIARSWSRSADGKTWTFELPAGRVFADGTPLDASAVKFNFDRWRLRSHPAHGSFPYPYYADVFGGFPGAIADVRAPSPTRVVITLAKPLGPFLRDIAEQSFAIGSPAAITADPKGFELKPIGSAAYQLAEWVRNDHITLVANPKWPGPKPVYGTVIIRDIPDQATSVLSIQKGDIDILTDPRPDDARALAGQTGISVVQQPSNNVSYVAMETEKKPFTDVRVRRAVAYALDVATMARSLYSSGAVVADNWTPPGMLGATCSVKAYALDVP